MSQKPWIFTILARLGELEEVHRQIRNEASVGAKRLTPPEEEALRVAIANLLEALGPEAPEETP